MYSRGVLRFDLKALMNDYESRTGLHLSYDELSQMTNISTDTLKSLATRENYNATLSTIERVCVAVGANPIQYLVWSADQKSDGNQTNR
jgi:DNA-binding Xre family transcriptional regulator